MSVFPDTQVLPTIDGRRASVPRDSFRSQTPIALLAIVAIAAILAVNTAGTRDVLAVDPGSMLPAECADCGVIVAIRPIAAADSGVVGSNRGFALEVRMGDGSRRIVEQLATGLDIGDRVRVNGDALTPVR